MSPDSEEIELTVPKAHRRNFPSVEQIQDNGLSALLLSSISTLKMKGKFMAEKINEFTTSEVKTSLGSLRSDKSAKSDKSDKSLSKSCFGKILPEQLTEKNLLSSNKTELSKRNCHYEEDIVRRSNLIHNNEIATLPLVARNDKKTVKALLPYCLSAFKINFPLSTFNFPLVY